MNSDSQKRFVMVEETISVKSENLKVENEVESEISLNDDIPPRINLKINDVHTVKEEEFYPGHQVDLLQLKEELLDIKKDHLAIEDTNLYKLENLEVKNEVESEILLNDVSPLVNLNMKSNELRIKDFHTVKTKDGMVFYPCRVIIDKLTIKGSTKNCKRCVNNSVYDGIIKQKFSECNCGNGDVTTENLVKDNVNFYANEKKNSSNFCQKSLSHENSLKTKLIAHNEEKNYVCNFCHKVFNYSSNLKKHLNIHTKEKNYISKVAAVIDLSHIMITNLYT
ncbi:uncharacterized protein LOC142322777 [Lycorma delicatula]|uniref:uncharacterized protein LOC142322777 n=1 Tax=Lycorma delicatula TaxID=130591 RepID=UPI003F517582